MCTRVSVSVRLRPYAEGEGISTACAVVPRGTCVCILCAPRHACSHVLTDAAASLWSHWFLETLVLFLPNTGFGIVEIESGL